MVALIDLPGLTCPVGRLQALGGHFGNARLRKTELQPVVGRVGI